MEATEAVQNWRNLSDFIFARVSGADKSSLSESDYYLLNKEGNNIIKNIAIDELFAETKKIMNLNILEKDVDFSFFDKVPNLWSVYYKGAEGILASE